MVKLNFTPNTTLDIWLYSKPKNAAESVWVAMVHDKLLTMHFLAGAVVGTPVYAALEGMRQAVSSIPTPCDITILSDLQVLVEAIEAPQSEWMDRLEKAAFPEKGERTLRRFTGYSLIPPGIIQARGVTGIPFIQQFADALLDTLLIPSTQEKNR